MHPGISTHVFLPQRLAPEHLDALVLAGATAIEIFAARHHFDYADRKAVHEIAAWFHANDVRASMHLPLWSNADWSRHIEPSLNLIDVEKLRRIDAMDEVKRALEAAEQVPLRSAVVHLGQREDKWSERSLDLAITALEHLQAFAQPLGVQLLIENLTSEVAEPEHLRNILHMGHFHGIGFCLDTGHAHIFANDGLRRTFDVFGSRVVELHLHDNHGMRDEHLWPGGGTIDWTAVERELRRLPDAVGVLEIAHNLHETPESVIKKAHTLWDRFKRLAEQPEPEQQGQEDER
jgi:sugar phosphate isomerase/epimerase